MKKHFTAAVLLLACSTHLFAESSTQTILELMEKTNTFKNIDAISNFTKKSLSSTDKLSPEIKKNINISLSKAIKRKEYHTVYLEKFKEYYNENYCKKVIEWYQKPLGKKLSKSLSLNMSEDNFKNFEKFKQNLNADIKESNRYKEMIELNILLRVSENNIEIFSGLMKCMKNVIPVILNKPCMTTLEVDKWINDGINEFILVNNEEAILELLYTLQTTNSSELNQFKYFLKSPAGAWYISAEHKSTIHTYKNIFSTITGIIENK